MTPTRLLVAGIGNIFLGDDAFGVEVAQRLMRRPQPEGVRVADFGIRGIDLIYALSDGCESAILIDAVPRGQTPGTLYVIEPQVASPPDAAPSPVMLEGHSMDPVKVLAAVASMGAGPRTVLVVGCEPTPIGDEHDMRIGMSDPVRIAIEPAIALVEETIERLLKAEESRPTAPESSDSAAGPSVPSTAPSTGDSTW